MMGENRESPPVRAARPLRLAVSGLLILIPVVLSLAVPLYQRSGPALIGIPFFYWFQMSMAICTAIATSTAYRLLYSGDTDEAEAAA
ncbi:DUF3311 domain-containing protein [Streptomyces sp. NBC_01012]|uniref:DUF3311 domain-containing protein n=1 Tax=Streptomyces sp. NBC_01012 TaxID=2903717 RepID=UPI00386679D9|nr:DUF3311 domain-containing protein [Streptomyces sp. NBC_01012]